MAYDHPAAWDLYPDQRFATTGPQPTGMPHTAGQRIFPVSARDNRGHDCLPQLLEIDRQYVEPPADPRFTGYAQDHWLELDFGDQLRQLGPDAPLILYLHGWVEYTFSHVNYAAAQAGLKLRGPSIEVPEDNFTGSLPWATCGRGWQGQLQPGQTQWNSHACQWHERSWIDDLHVDH